jgi:Plant transposon protein
MGQHPFSHYEDATKKPGIFPLVKLVGCFRFLAFGDAYDREDENLHISESSLRVIVREFCALMVKEFGSQYLNRSPTHAERKTILKVMSAKGFPGCLGSWDCKHFVWDRCPMRLAGQHKGHHDGEKKTLILEAIADHRKYIWAANFGDPGSLNDLNVLDKSSIVAAMLNGTLRIQTEPYKVNRHEQDWMYFLVDGIYPEWSIFVNTYSDPDTPEKQKFAKQQERVRKDVECAFGILVQRFHVLQRPLRGWQLEDLDSILKVSIILHNMIVEEQFGTVDNNDNDNVIPSVHNYTRRGHA